MLIISMLDYLLKFPVESFSVFVKLFPIAAIWFMMEYRKKVSRWLFIYLVFQLMIGLLMLWLGANRENNLFYYNLSVFAGFPMLARMFYEAFHDRKDHLMVIYTYVIFFIVVGADFMNVGTDRSLKVGGTLECLFLILYISRFCWQIMKELVIIDLFRYPLFWAAAGMLFYAASKTFVAPLFHYIDVWDGPGGFEVHVLLPSIIECIYLITVGVGYLSSK
jgi:hypothetical protein